MAMAPIVFWGPQRPPAALTSCQRAEALNLMDDWSGSFPYPNERRIGRELELITLSK